MKEVLLYSLQKGGKALRPGKTHSWKTHQIITENINVDDVLS
jgi:hypothetical protein